MLEFHNNRVYSNICLHSQLQRTDIGIVQTTHQFHKIYKFWHLIVLSLLKQKT